MNRTPSKPSTHPNRRVVRGFTLIELLVTMIVLAILLGIGVPSFARIIATNRMATQTNDFLAALKLARAEAIRRGQPVAIRATTVGSPTNFGTGWTVFTDANGDGSAGSSSTDGTTIRVNSAFSGSTNAKRVTSALANYTGGDRGYLVFNGRGGNANAAAFFKICDANNPSIQGRVIQVSVVGTITLDSTTATCP